MESILIIDDHPIFVEGMKALVHSVMPDADIKSCENGNEALKMTDFPNQFDWIFLDINLPDMTGFELLKQFYNKRLLANVLIISSDENPESIHQALDLHANGYISKQFNADIFKQCISTVNNGEVYLDDRHTLLLQNYREGIFLEKKHIEKSLSERQREALFLIEKGMSNQEIAELMNVTQSTVKTHISLLMNLFSADNRSHCVAEAKRLGILK